MKRAAFLAAGAAGVATPLVPTVARAATQPRFEARMVDQYGSVDWQFWFRAPSFGEACVVAGGVIAESGWAEQAGGYRLVVSGPHHADQSAG